MAEDDADSKTEEKSERRQVLEIRPKDPSPEVNDAEPPRYSLGGVLNTVKKKGLLEALADDAWGPHVHLTLLLTVIIFIAIVTVAMWVYVS
ncbi:MAG: hypothetical protein JSV49_07080 [Thermoplasmata archaeon]|nr:MAG: hypothetical protein JSV49_07080 [Thermoplasmata archaeon]